MGRSDFRRQSRGQRLSVYACIAVIPFVLLCIHLALEGIAMPYFAFR